MRKVLLFVLGMIAGGGLVCFGFKYHVVRTGDGLILVPKKQATLVDIYADIRNWSPGDWQTHPELAQSLIARGRGDLIGTPANGILRDLMRKFDHAEHTDDDRRLE